MDIRLDSASNSLLINSRFRHVLVTIVSNSALRSMTRRASIVSLRSGSTSGNRGTHDNGYCPASFSYTILCGSSTNPGNGLLISLTGS
eukprot:4976932-Amphidinium_carterae.2